MTVASKEMPPQRGLVRHFAATALFAATAASAALMTAAPVQAAPAKVTLTGQQLQDRMLHRRAVETAIWGIPAVNTELMLQAARKAGAEPNQIVYWSKLLTWKNQTLTPNPDAIYFMPFWNTKDVGPVVVELPPAEGGSITGSLMDEWQMPMEDAGTAGVDKGKGGKYLILPPGYKDKVPEGYIVLPSQVYQGYGLLRSILKSRSEQDIASAVEYGKRIKIYPLSAAAATPDSKFVDADGKLFDAVIPYDERFFETLHRVVQTEPWLERDRAMIDPLKMLGIEKGKPFAPDARTKAQMRDALKETKLWFDHFYETHYEPFNKGTRWFLPASKELLSAVGNGFTDINSYPIDERACAYYFAFSGVKNMGAGQFYLFVSRDKAGAVLDGSKQYVLHIPPDAPVQQYWSLVLYDFDTHALIRDMPWSSRSSLASDLVKNKDGSVDVYFGPTAPNGKEKNWIPTKRGGRVEALFRLYGPQKALFDKTWILPDIEAVR